MASTVEREISTPPTTAMILPRAVPLALAAPPTGESPSPPSASAATASITPNITKSSNPRRLPSPCWSPEETIALINSYCEKWYSLSRSNLKATHWQEVADSVFSRCPAASPAKTAVQCRHKMEKLRQRYRTEIQRARSMPVSRLGFTSSWVHFKLMDSMEKGPAEKKSDAYNSNLSAGDNDDDDKEDEEDHHQDYKYNNNNGSVNTRNVNKLYLNSTVASSSHTHSNGGYSSGPFQIRIPTGVSIGEPGIKIPKFDQKYGSLNPNYRVNSISDTKPNINMGYRTGVYDSGRSVAGKREKDDSNPMTEMVVAIKNLGDGFMRTEQMKMDMAREMETMRMKMEMRRTEMILESQHRIIEGFAKAISEKRHAKKLKRKLSPRVLDDHLSFC